LETDHPPKNDGIPTWVMWTLGVFAAAAAVFICVLGYWLVDRQPPLIAVSGRFAGWDREVPRRGHVVWGGIQVRADCEGTIYRFIVDGEIVRLEPRKWEYRGPVDEEEQIPTTWDAPFDIPPHINHDAKYRNRFEFICNPLHKFWPIPVSPPDVPYYLREKDKISPYINGNNGNSKPPVGYTPWE
jgi:hypothetical protein